MKLIGKTILAVVASCCLSALAVAATSPDEKTEFLVNSAAADFAKNGGCPAEVRNVRIGYLQEVGAPPVHLLCGEFLRESKLGETGWVYFATLKTEGYEQWIGGIAESFCAKAKLAATESESLEEKLKGRLTSACTIGN